jgi:four helix bundle protein
MKDFRELKIWQKAFEIAQNGIMIFSSVPVEEEIILHGVITRTAILIPSRIAEGYVKDSDVELDRSLDIAFSLCHELETQLIIAKELNCGDKDLIVRTIELLDEEKKMLDAFSAPLREGSKRGNLKVK